MDLRNLINDDEKARGKKEAQGTSATTPAPPSLSAQPSTPSHYGHTSQQQTPLYAPPSAGAVPSRPQLSQGVTPLRTPSQTSASTQYPFPQPAQQSPISATPGQHYRPFESQPTVPTPAKPGSHGRAYQSAQSAAYASQTPMQQQNPYTSISPTPPSHLSRTPSSMRQSPMATASHLPSQQQQQQQHYSQPNTPLGPPPLYQQRAQAYPETQSPYHQRTFSNASNGLISGSPAQHHPGIPNLVESPNAYARPSPQRSHSRRPSEYMSQTRTVSRERSISVSPKTKPPPRIPSLTSQQSSNAQELYNQAQRTPEQYSNHAPLAGSTTSHVMTQVQHQSQQQPSRLAGYPSAASDVPQASTQQSTSHTFPPLASQSSLSASQASQPSQPQPASSISHQSEKMGMSHLVTPGSEVPIHINGSQQRDVADGPRNNKSATPGSRALATPQNSSMQQDGSGRNAPAIEMAQQRGDGAGANGGMNDPVTAANDHLDSQSTRSLKRPASSPNKMEEPPTKQFKASSSRKYTERPIWARLSKHNPRYAQQGPVSDAPNGRPIQPRVNGGGPAARDAAAGSRPNAAVTGDQPVDTDMVRIRGMLGEWERSYKNSQPLPDTKRVIADWMFTQLAQLRDVGTDPHYGTVEIEGKIGTLFHKDTGERCNFPVMNTVILSPQQSDAYRFESRMQESEHAHMNTVLNAALRDSLSDPARIKMHYKHFTDIDSFRPLSPAGLQALPPSIRKRSDHSRPPRLRTTVRHEKGRSPYIAARIVKVNVANLQIYSPNDPYDLRISINVEVNLDRPDLAPEDLVVGDEDSPKEPPQPDRRKDRISYNHLAYQIDLTRVDVGGAAGTKGPKPIYELEIEVDAQLLRAQMRIAEEGGRECAYGDVVAGFWDDAVLLMRERPPQQPAVQSQRWGHGRG